MITTSFKHYAGLYFNLLCLLQALSLSPVSFVVDALLQNLPLALGYLISAALGLGVRVQTVGARRGCTQRAVHGVVIVGLVNLFLALSLMHPELSQNAMFASSFLLATLADDIALYLRGGVRWARTRAAKVRKSAYRLVKRSPR